MSALKIIPIKGKEEKFCSFDECIKDGLIRFATYRIRIIDYDAGTACKDCAKNFKRLWDSGLNERHS